MKIIDKILKTLKKSENTSLVRNSKSQIFFYKARSESNTQYFLEWQHWNVACWNFDRIQYLSVKTRCLCLPAEAECNSHIQWKWSTHWWWAWFVNCVQLFGFSVHRVWHTYRTIQGLTYSTLEKTSIRTTICQREKKWIHYSDVKIGKFFLSITIDTFWFLSIIIDSYRYWTW